MLDFIEEDKKVMGNSLCRLRRQRGITQEELAELMEVDPQTVYRMEKGRYFVDTFLAAICVLKIDLKEVFPIRSVHVHCIFRFIRKQEGQIHYRRSYTICVCSRNSIRFTLDLH